jgi:integrase/recombinase XerD
MPKLPKNTAHEKAVAFLDYKPAELRLNKQWLIVYYAKNPLTKELERFRLSVPVIASKSERIKYAKKIVLEINKKLDSGWLPYYSNSGTNEFKTYEYCFKKFLEHTAAEVENKTKRPDTLRSYTSYFNMINKYVVDKKIKLNLILELNKPFVVNYLDWIYFERKNSPATYNNHLTFVGNFVNYCIGRGYMKENFTVSILRKKEDPKKRQVLTVQVKEKLKKLQNDEYSYFALCMATYFCFIRRTELTKLKVENVNLNKSYINIPKEISKNGKDENVTIPNAFAVILAKHLVKAKNDDYLFSDDNFKTGKKQLKPKKISDNWVKFQKKYKVGKEFQFYSLKDTGITDLLISGIPAIKVRDQARHYDLKITEKYTARNKACDETVRNSNFDF